MKKAESTLVFEVETDLIFIEEMKRLEENDAVRDLVMDDCCVRDTARLVYADPELTFQS